MKAAAVLKKIEKILNEEGHGIAVIMAKFQKMRKIIEEWRAVLQETEDE